MDYIYKKNLIEFKDVIFMNNFQLIKKLSRTKIRTKIMIFQKFEYPPISGYLKKNTKGLK